MSRLIGWLHRLEWWSPYSEPPDGVRVKMEIYIPADVEGCRQTPKEIEDAWVPGKGYGGYCHSVRAVTKLPREMCQETLKVIRQKRLRRRVEESCPLFAEHFIAEELGKKAEYYEGITDEKYVRARREMAEEERELFERLNIVQG